MTGLSSGSPRSCGTLIAGSAQERTVRLELAKAHVGLQRETDSRKRRIMPHDDPDGGAAAMLVLVKAPKHPAPHRTMH